MAYRWSFCRKRYRSQSRKFEWIAEECHSREGGNPGGLTLSLCLRFLDARLRGHDGRLSHKIQLTDYSPRHRSPGGYTKPPLPFLAHEPPIIFRRINVRENAGIIKINRHAIQETREISIFAT